MDVIADAAGLSKGSIYRYFPDKQGLFRAAILAAIGHALDNLHLSASDPELRVRRIWALATDPKFAPAYRLSLIEGRSSNLAAAAAQIIDDRLTKPFADYLRQTKPDSTPSPEEALVLSRLVIATLLGASLAGLTAPGSLSARIAFLLRACSLDAQSPQADGF